MAVNFKTLDGNTSVLPFGFGVYELVCLPTGKFYIGSASGRRGFRDRVRDHWTHLRRGEHRSRYLQNAFNKYGSENFEFRILEMTDQNQAVKAEQRYLDLRRPYLREIGFNTNLVATSHLGVKRSAATCRKLSRIQQQLCSDPTHLAKIIQCNQERSKAFCLEKNGRLFRGRNVKAFARKYGIRGYGNLIQVLLSKRACCHGFHLPGCKVLRRRYLVTTPHGERYVTDNLNQFCKIHGLGVSGQVNLSWVTLGKKSQHKGWKAEVFHV